MNRYFAKWLLPVVVISVTLSAQRAAAQEPGWLPVIVADGELREHLDSLPIVHRPYRPFHFYGNTIRRSHYRGNPLPRAVDVRRTISAALQVPGRY